ncbi:MAG: SurA N-terminal domain-containing protein [Candidatus Tectomicrobia bacterium]|uniref:SurA N-terminal domain-containing protein n=1 Tax=Tectimicrobiota bacterium TaxID=2528274 RepID=A0A932FYL4_UNCTE|nr:SurA N-terminal domain-containing protein [Candidatus Tectomicrobia bacterium]
MRWLGGLCFLVLVLGGGPAWAADPEKAPEKARVVAEVDGEKITAEELDRSMAALLYSVEEQLFQVRTQKLEELIGERLLAKEAARRKIAVKELVEQEITAKSEKVTDQEIEAVYQSNRARLPGSEAEAKGRVRTFLQNQKSQKVREQFLASLKGQAKIAIYLEQPEPPVRAEIQLAGSPAKGSEKAPVTIVEFTDYQ